MVKTSAVALESPIVRQYLEELRKLIALEIKEQQNVFEASTDEEIHWSPKSREIILPILVYLANEMEVPQATLQAIINEVSQSYFAQIRREYHGSIKIRQVVR